MGMSAKERAEDARRRLLQAADELFYAEGVNTVGIDRVIERAGVAKATLYSAFGSKEELIRAYLKARHEAYQQRMEIELERRFATPKERLVGAFEIQGQSFTDPDFHGCPFISASAEARPGSAAQQESHTFRRWVHALFFDLAQEAGARDPKALAQQLVLLFDGAAISAWMDRDPSAEAAARTVATALVDAAVPSFNVD
jgi:AcrR family transcriptional regulator